MANTYDKLIEWTFKLGKSFFFVTVSQSSLEIAWDKHTPNDTGNKFRSFMLKLLDIHEKTAEEKEEELTIDDI